MASFDRLFRLVLLVAAVYVLGFYREDVRPWREQWQVNHPLSFDVKLPNGEVVQILSHAINPRYRK